MLQILIDSIDRTSLIDFGSINKKDAINQQADTLSFNLTYHPGQTFRPETDSEVIMYDGATKVFGGKVIGVKAQNNANGSVKYQVQCTDYSADLGMLVNEQYEDLTVEEIIGEIIDNFAPGFTYNNVSCTLEIEKISFDRVSVKEALQRLSDATSYSWYIDYDKDIHFFEKNTEPSPFNLADNDGNFITESLQLSDDFTQIRNRVFIKGGEVEGEQRTEYFNGDGTKKQFKLSNKFASKPTVEVGGTPKTVGIDYLDNETDFDCFWDYNQQYIRFKDTTIPGSGTNNITVTSIPLYNLVVQVDDPISIAEYGVREFAKTDTRIRSRDEALSLAKAEITAYKNGLVEGSFQTYTSGLRSGQVISINSTLMGVADSFLIQSVSYKQLTTEQGMWNVQLATLKTISIIDFLISLLKSGDKISADMGEVVLEKTVFPQENISLGDDTDINTDDIPKDETAEIEEENIVQDLDYPTKFVAGPYIPGDETEEATTEEIVAEYDQSNRNTYFSGMHSGGWVRTGECFNVSETIKVKKLQVILNKAFTPTGTLTAKLYSMTGTLGVNGKPTGSALVTSSSVDLSTLVTAPTAGTLIDFDFAEEELPSGNYCWLIDATGVTGNGSNYVNMGMDSTSPTYEGNAFAFVNGGADYNVYTNYDFVFYLTADVVRDISPKRLFICNGSRLG